MPSVPSSSLIVSTYNWEAALGLVLRSVLAQSRLPDEVLIADDGSGPATAELVASYARRCPVPLRHVWHEDRGFRLAAIRNRALAIAEGDYIIMIDGDTIVHPEFVGSHVAFARRGSYVQGGRVMLREAVTRRLLAGERVELGPFTRGIGNRVNAIHASALSRFYSGPSGPVRRTRGANLAYWRDDAVRVNGFNEDIEGWGREDSEFVARMLNVGVRRRNLKFAGVAYHLHHKTRSPADLAANHAIYERAIREGLTWCENGLDKYRMAELVGATRG